MINKNSVKIVENYFKDRAFDMITPKGKLFKHDYVCPGKQYEGDLWDWDSFFSVKALIAICEYFKGDKDFDYESKKASVINAGKGCVLNFIESQLPDGYIPITLTPALVASGALDKIHIERDIVNQHKPFLCQSIVQISDYSHDYNWFDIEPVIKYIDYYRREQFNERVGMYIYKSDYMIGIDNNPSVYGFPYGSTADLYLNCFMYIELLSLVKILQLKKDDRAKKYLDEAERLKNTIIEECYDKRDGFFYSVFVDLSNRRNADLGWHAGMVMHWKTVLLKIRSAMSFMPMYAKIATDEQAKVMIEKHLLDPAFYSAHGLRSLASDEKMYTLEPSSNPSNSIGPVWLIYNYMAFCGVLNYGRKDLAEKICSDMVENFAKDIIEHGKTDECYNPDTGKPIMNLSFLSWNSLIIYMLNEIK